jgi:opacity protein-like surface antigen
MSKLIMLCMLLPMAALSQNRLHVTLFGGFSNYQGDLQNKPFTLDQAHLALGGGLSYDITSHIAIRGELKYGRIEAADRYNIPSLQKRNLSFASKLYEASLLGEYTFLDMDFSQISPYVFAGFALYHFSPYAFDTTGKKVFLQPLSTEGQGLPEYPDRKVYQRTQIAIPFGGGVKFRVRDNVNLGFEIGMRKLFTDYLDDVSTTYVDEATLLAAKGPKAVEMAYRGGELKNGNPNFPPSGATRGGAKYKDWYYFSGITLSIGINTGQSSVFHGGGNRGRVDCPPKL